MTRPAIGSINPFFTVSDVAVSIAFYRDRLGFEVRDADGYVLFFGRPRETD